MESPSEIVSLKIQFQGGFVGTECSIDMFDEQETVISKEPFYPDDINSMQEFKLVAPSKNVKKLILRFGNSTDFYGRIIIYKLELIGNSYY